MLVGEEPARISWTSKRKVLKHRDPTLPKAMVLKRRLPNLSDISALFAIITVQQYASLGQY